jgi:hypothetical protein
MKNKLLWLTLFASVSLLQGCGSDMLGSSDAEDHKLTPEVVTEDPNPKKPTAGLPVLRASGSEIQYMGVNNLFHGANLQYADSPVIQYPGIQAIHETGSNVVRIIVHTDTTASDLEAALVKASAEQLFVILTLDDPKLYCTDDETAFSDAVKTTWLKTFLPVIYQDRFQGNLMISIARGWGPKDVFNGASTGYKTYIDNYKTAIRAFRKGGFQVPIVIDAPCGTDYYAFAADRGKELLAADVEKNLVLSVHAYGSYWNSNSKIDTAMEVLTSQKMPIIMTEFGGSGVGEKPVKHKQIIEKAAGDYAFSVSIPWKDAQDKVAYIAPFDSAVDLTNTDVSFDVMFDSAYINDGQMGFQMYFRDENGEYANAGWNGVWQQTPGQWNTMKVSIKNKASFGWASDNFNMKRVTKVGLELVSNGKAPAVIGDIKFDNFKVIEGSGAKELFNQSFTASITGWETAWENTVVALDAGNGVALTRATGNNQVVAIFKGITGVDFTKPIEIKANVYVPAGYAGSWTYGKFFNSEGAWLTSSDMGSLTYGAWNEIILTADFGAAGAGLSQLGIQMGNLGSGEASANPNFYGAIVIKDLVISGVATNDAFKLGTIYNQTFDGNEDNWVAFSWGDSATVEAGNGALNITAKNANADRIDVQHQNPAKIDGFNFKEPFTLKAKIYIPAYYQNTSLMVQFYMQDSNWSNHFNVIDLSYEDLVIGGWNDINVKVEFPDEFNRDGLPKHMGFSFATNFDSTIEGPAMSQTDPIKIDDLIFEGMVPVEKEEVVFGLVDFFYQSQFDSLAVDFTAGVILRTDLEGKGAPSQRSAAFSWLAWSWFGNSTENAAWDMTTNVASPTTLTDRGEDIVNGKGGIKDYLPAEEN